jgi:predicted phosphoribosyltransferase
MGAFFKLTRRRRFADRRHAGAALADYLQHFAGKDDVVVLGLPRGGVPVAYEIARRIRAPLDIFIVRTLGFPSQPELAMGAIASGGVRVLNEEAFNVYQPAMGAVDVVTRAERMELERRERVYRNGRRAAAVEGRVVILVDDGLATSSTMRLAVLALRRLRPGRIVVAVPVGARDAYQAIREIADEVVCPLTPEPLSGVERWYVDFSPTTDNEVQQLLTAQAEELNVEQMERIR